MNDLGASESMYHVCCKINFDNEPRRKKILCVKFEEGEKDEVLGELYSLFDK